MTPVFLRAPLRLSLLLVLALTFAACTATANQPTEPPPAEDNGAGAEPVGGNPDQPVSGVPGQPVEPMPVDNATPVQPEPGIVDALPHAWDRLVIGPDGRTITVYYWGGVEDCYGLAGVQVERDEDGLLTVRVLEGRRGDLPPDTACIEIALLKSVTVELDEPIVAPVE